ncbi:AzlC family ABC transporter permease [Corynebacterium aquatimens]|uniref:4-azaleucine resistance transporter AzlC n=1 Tax=Corynebacterium aquatimens TaxID=1190508 RepID=A0A931GXX5_9CORY|nr:AzlC family ABC transporter permease [Corynebacterium aquatimens]MBG6122729.1 4-azaleucine resistance transporter AzlC [Corynebacterium aquatimens]WJY66934.1 Inner membrane protein YgaZ [Corynebacterium aquatimens]
MTAPQPSRRQAIRQGIRDTWLVGLGLIPLGLAFGLVITQAGFAWWWAPIFSIIIYAGSMEFLAVSMVTQGVGPISAAVTGFMVNFRHIFYGLTHPRETITSPAARAYATYSLTDEVYAITSAPPHPTGARLVTIHALCQLMWVIPGIVGALIGEIIPPDITGMEFALTALFVVLAYESFQTNRDFSLPLSALIIAAVVAAIVPQALLIIALTTYFIILLVRFWFPRLDQALTLTRTRTLGTDTHG